MSIFSGCYVALGTGAPGGVLTELTGGSYARQAMSLTGTFQGGATQALPAFGAATGPTITTVTALTPTQIRAGAIFDAATGGSQLCHWSWPPPWSWTPIATAFPAITLNLTLIGTLAASFNTFKSTITPGDLLGTMNGSPLLASANLPIVNGALATATAQTPGAITDTLSKLAALPSYANDAAAAAGGVPQFSHYRNGNFVMVRTTP